MTPDNGSETPDLICSSSHLKSDGKSVAIFLATYNGGRFLAEQLDSIERQTHKNWHVYASDDGSTDDTVAILEAYKSKWSEERITIAFGPQKGYVSNFMSLTLKSEIKADYYAYSDQDDVWEAYHLTKALACLSTVPVEVPALYSSRTRYIDANGLEIGYSRFFRKEPSFRNALVQCIAGGNTMVFNDAARRLLTKLSINKQIVSHDWWAYLLIAGCGGHVFYDTDPGVNYRQHGSNIAGQNVSLLAKLHRIHFLVTGLFREWTHINVSALTNISEYLTRDNYEALILFNKARQGFVISRLRHLYKSGVYRQTAMENMGLVFATMLKKM